MAQRLVHTLRNTFEDRVVSQVSSLDLAHIPEQICAAFVNAVLQESELPDNYDHPNPYMARSFLEWGEAVDSPQQGDVVVFPRGNTGWKGHVGFYLDSVVMNGNVYYRILGGNQGNSVSIDLYPAHTALGIRRAE